MKPAVQLAAIFSDRPSQFRKRARGGATAAGNRERVAHAAQVEVLEELAHRSGRSPRMDGENDADLGSVGNCFFLAIVRNWQDAGVTDFPGNGSCNLKGVAGG